MSEQPTHVTTNDEKALLRWLQVQDETCRKGIERMDKAGNEPAAESWRDMRSAYYEVSIAIQNGSYKNAQGTK